MTLVISARPMHAAPVDVELGRAPGAGRTPLAAGLDALADGRWQDAAAALSRAASAATDTPADHARATAGLSDACWWLGRVEEALGARAAAYDAWRVAGDDGEAARAAMWIARECRAALADTAASTVWLGRAEAVSSRRRPRAVTGWLAFTRSCLADDPAEQAKEARSALKLGRRIGDQDLEVLALGRLGTATIATGDLLEGIRDLNLAMTTATGGGLSLATLAEVCCELVTGSELSGEIDRFAPWNDAVEALVTRHGHPTLIARYATCCATAFTASGDWVAAEGQLRDALARLASTGHHARRAAPTARLADLLITQGRFEEAARLVADDDQADSLLVRGRMALEHGDLGTAVTLLERASRRFGADSLLTAPALAPLAQAHLASGNRRGAKAAAARLARVAAASGNTRVAGQACLARARIAAHDRDTRTAVAALGEAIGHLDVVAPGALETAESRFELARLLADDAPNLAASTARTALLGFEAARATHRADAAAALLSALDERNRIGAKLVGVLTDMERDVLRLVAEGRTNAEIAARLYIAPRVAGHHVSSILAKLGLRRRAEAATYASRLGLR